MVKKDIYENEVSSKGIILRQGVFNSDVKTNITIDVRNNKNSLTIKASGYNFKTKKSGESNFRLEHNRRKTLTYIKKLNNMLLKQNSNKDFIKLFKKLGFESN